LESLPVICGVAEDLSSKFGLLDNIGCHLILYRDGKNSIHWHADDTQGEDVVLSLLTVDGPMADARTICFQPATTMLKTGDEQLELYPIPGDRYSMDGNVQASYVHAMLKTRPSHVATTGHMAIIFRNGIHKMYDDNGSSVTSLAAPVHTNQCVFGNMCNKLEEVLLARFPIQLASTLEWAWQDCRKQRDWMSIANCLQISKGLQ
jgi:RNA-binding protein YhbY